MVAPVGSRREVTIRRKPSCDLRVDLGRGPVQTTVFAPMQGMASIEVLAGPERRRPVEHRAAIWLNSERRPVRAATAL